MKSIARDVGLFLFGYIFSNVFMFNELGACQLRASVIIPCHSIHAVHLLSLLSRLEEQTLLPWEVVIALSDLDEVPTHILERLVQTPRVFPVMLITSRKVLYAGQNRNLACRHAQGDIIICQDADDIPHPQRVEMISYFFEQYNCDLLVHTFLRTEEKKSIVFSYYEDFESVKRVNPENYETVVKNAIVNGSIAAKSGILKKYLWPSSCRGQDVTFNRMLFNHIPNRLLIYAPLYAYRHYLSSIASVTCDCSNYLLESSVQDCFHEREVYPVTRIVNDGIT